LPFLPELAGAETDMASPALSTCWLPIRAQGRRSCLARRQRERRVDQSTSVRTGAPELTPDSFRSQLVFGIA